MKTIVFTFGRFNPPTIAHEMIVQSVVQLAKANKCEHMVFISHTQNNTTDPLSWKEKVNIFRKAFPGISVDMTPSNKNPYVAASSMIKEMGYRKLIFVVGADRYEDFGQPFIDFCKKEGAQDCLLFNAGNREGHSDGLTSVSASQARQHAISGNFFRFAQLMPSTLTVQDKQQIFDKLREILKP